jgi:hypothetical protein
MGLSALVLVCLAALGGCDGAPATARAALPPPSSFAISYERGGGLASSTSRLLVRPGRHAIAETGSGRAGEHRVEFRIGKRRVLALERGLRQAGFGSIESPGPSGCADCFEYDFFYLGHYLELDDSQMPPRLGAVVAQIEAIISAHTASPKA